MSFPLPNELVEQIDGQSLYARIGAALVERMQLRPGARIPARKDSLLLEAQNLPTSGSLVTGIAFYEDLM